MIEDLLKNIDTIYIACGVTDFRMQSNSLCNLIRNRRKIKRTSRRKNRRNNCT